MATSLRDKLIDALDKCPCCGAYRREVNKPEDGIPEKYIYEAVFGCGAAAFISKRDQYDVGRACPSGLDSALVDLQDEVEEKLENEDDGEDDQS